MQPVKLNARVCDVCLEQREDSDDKFQCATAIACTAKAATVAPNSACQTLHVCVRVPSAVQEASKIAVEPLYSSTVNFSCAALSAVCTPIDGKCKIAIVNPSSKPIEIRVDSPIAAVKAVTLKSSCASAAATAPRLSSDEKLRKVLHELKIDALPENTPHKQQLLSMVSKYLDVFAESDADVGTTNLTFHEIDTDYIRPLRQPERRIPYGEMRTAVESEIEKLVGAQIARPSTSPWASPVVMVQKKDGGWRMCVDYRRLYSVTKFDCVPLPRLDETLDAFAGATVFSSLDLAMSYHQVPVKPSDVEKTAFITHVGL